jgi:hypothetical protein
MSVTNLATQILRMVSGGDPAVESKIELAELEYQIKLAGATVGKDEYLEAKKLENQGYVDGSWIVEYSIVTTSGPIASERVAVLPEAYLSIAGDKGVHKVTYISDGKRYTITQLPGPLFGTRMTARAATSKYYYTVKAGRLIISNDCEEDTNRIGTIYVDLAVSNDTTIDAAIGALIIERVLPWARLQAAIRPDMVADNSPNV